MTDAGILSNTNTIPGKQSPNPLTQPTCPLFLEGWAGLRGYGSIWVGWAGFIIGCPNAQWVLTFLNLSWPNLFKIKNFKILTPPHPFLSNASPDRRIDQQKIQPQVLTKDPSLSSLVESSKSNFW